MNSLCRNLAAACRLVLAAGTIAIVGCSKVGPAVDVTPTARLAVDAHLGKGWTSDSTRIETITKSFAPTETVYAAVDMPGSKEGTITARWMFKGAPVQEHTTTTQEGINVYRFELDPPAGGHAVGDYTFEVMLNNKTVETEHFSVHG